MKNVFTHLAALLAALMCEASLLAAVVCAAMGEWGYVARALAVAALLFFMLVMRFIAKD